MPKPILCDECGDAPATGKAWFNGRTLMDLCDACMEWWRNHGLIEARDDAHFLLPPQGVSQPERTGDDDG